MRSTCKLKNQTNQDNLLDSTSPIHRYPPLYNHFQKAVCSPHFIHFLTFDFSFHCTLASALFNSIEIALAKTTNGLPSHLIHKHPSAASCRIPLFTVAERSLGENSPLASVTHDSPGFQSSSFSLLFTLNPVYGGSSRLFLTSQQECWSSPARILALLSSLHSFSWVISTTAA